MLIKHNRRHSFVPVTHPIKGVSPFCGLCGAGAGYRLHNPPEYADSFGYSLAMRVMQSDLYAKLDGKERAECDELIRRGQ